MIQTVITGTIRQNAVSKLHAFDLDRYLDLGIGGYGSDVYPKGTQILRSLAMAAEKYGVQVSAQPRRSTWATRSGTWPPRRSRGVRCIGVATGRSTISELRDAGADPVLADLADTSRVVAAISR